MERKQCISLRGVPLSPSNCEMVFKIQGEVDEAYTETCTTTVTIY